jgi:hypothetical protein
MIGGFKYSKQWNIKENKFDIRHCEHNSLDRCDNNNHSREEEAAWFFIQPRLKIDDTIERHRITINVDGRANGLPTPVEVFQGFVWNLKVKNRYAPFTTFVEGCTGEVFIPNIDYRVQLLWQRPPPYVLPTEYTCGAGLIPGLDSYRQEYQRRLGVEYVGSLVTHGTPTINLPKTSSRELHFLFSFPSSNFAYIISPDGSWAWYDNDNFVNSIGEVSLILQIPGTYDIHITLSRQRKVRRFQLVINNYDDISIQSA